MSDLINEVTPMMAQYLETKKEYQDAILFYRLGDFYEMFFDDAQIASNELELTLTGKSCGLSERAPMCGVPFHAADSYISRLVSKGYKVAICEQTEDPKLAKGLVKREVIRIVTPGTILDSVSLDETKNNYLMSVSYFDGNSGISVCDITTGDFYLTEVNSSSAILDEIIKYSPSEIICNEAFLLSDIDFEYYKSKLGFVLFTLEGKYFDDERCTRTLCNHFKVNSLIGMGIDDFPSGIIAAGALIQYLNQTQKTSINHITHLYPYISSKYMLLDSSTRRNLELIETLRDKTKRGSLLWVLDKTKTAMGARTLRTYIEQPLIDKDEILLRLDSIEDLGKNAISRDEIREYLNPIYDLERLLAKISLKTALPRDLMAFKSSISMLPHIKSVLNDLKAEDLNNINSEIDDLSDVFSLIDEAILDEPALTLKEGGIIKDTFDENVSRLRNAKTQGKKWISELEEEDKERTGIKNLRIKYNKVFGYYYEVTNSYLNLVPEDYIRKQTLTGAERFTTPKLKELEDTILNAEDKLNALEYDIFQKIRDAIAGETQRIQKTAKAIAKLDVYCSLSTVAEKNGYVRPKINDKGVIKIKDGRHPVVEKVLINDLFIPNDTLLDNNKNCISVITGPNMAGKSTYMRQVALICLMAQIGSFVPAKEADICLTDRIFTRVGASDDLSSGQSTFMVEMNEVSNILRNATSASLLILDEIGRGTSTFDGLSIAWACLEHIANKRIIGAKTLFATHYHELTELENKMSNVNNYSIAVKEQGDDIIFLRKIIKGSADKSYGIQVAKLAGVPDMVIDRAKEILSELIDNDISEKIEAIAVDNKDTKTFKATHYDDVDLGQISMFDTTTDEDVINELKNIDIESLRPIDALNRLYKLQNMIKNRW